MLDAYLKQDGVITVKLIADYFGKQTSYQANAKVKGGEIWNNIKFELKNFKTEVGLNLKSFDKIEAIKDLKEKKEDSYALDKIDEIEANIQTLRAKLRETEEVVEGE